MKGFSPARESDDGDETDQGAAQPVNAAMPGGSWKKKRSVKRNSGSSQAPSRRLTYVLDELHRVQQQMMIPQQCDIGIRCKMIPPHHVARPGRTLGDAMDRARHHATGGSVSRPGEDFHARFVLSSRGLVSFFQPAEPRCPSASTITCPVLQQYADPDRLKAPLFPYVGQREPAGP